MKKIFIVFIQVFGTIVLQAQNQPIQDSVLIAITDDSIYTKVDVEADFPGLQRAWIRYLTNNLVYPPHAIEQRVEGTVIVEFVVEKDGRLTNMHVISGPELLREEALRIYRKSGKWTVAIKDGRKVRSYKRMPLTLRLSGG
ncbi:MAG: energy transducer TonB [Chitinophagaceae bacterium]